MGGRIIGQRRKRKGEKNETREGKGERSRERRGRSRVRRERRKAKKELLFWVTLIRVNVPNI